MNKGSKAIFLGLGKDERRALPHKIQKAPPADIQAEVFCKGCLVISGSQLENPAALLEHFSEWPLVILVDSAKETVSSQMSFLWTIFTRFEPARDIYTKTKLMHNHISYSFPLLIDARMKPSYPKEVAVDEKTDALVSSKWPYGCKGIL